jgi:ABC-2 type transport system permease protein
MLILRKLIAFIKRDFIIDTSYKMAFGQRIFASFLPILMIYFINKLMTTTAMSHMHNYGENYFAFAVLGICVLNYFNTALLTFKSSIRRTQMAGCLEAILSSQTDTTTVILLSSVYSFVISTIHLLIAFAIISIFGYDFIHSNWMTFIVVLLIGIVIFISLGIISAAFTIIYKKADPLGFVFGSLSFLLGGIFFPVSLFPEWLQVIVKFLPITFILEAVRMALLKGKPVNELWTELGFMISGALVLFPFSLMFFNRLVSRSKRTGTLIHY